MVKNKKKDKKNKSKKSKNNDGLADVPVSDILAQITRIMREHRSQMGAAMAALKLYPGQEQLLLLLRDAPLPPSQIAEALGVKAPTITKAVSRLEAHDLVMKTNVDHDGRMVVVALTAAGQALAEAFAPQKEAIEGEMLARLSGKQRQKLNTLLAQIAVPT